MVKKTLCLVAVVALFLTLSAVAQRTAAPSAINRNALGDLHVRSGNPDAPPANCSPCLFYAGDWDPASSWVAFFNGTDTGGPDGTVYVPFTVPAGQTFNVNGLFTNNLALNINKVDPKTSPWEVRQGIAEGTGGTQVAGGSANTKFAPTGRNYQNTYFEYYAQVKVPIFQLAAGSYWMAVTPQCKNANDSACSTAYYYITDTISRTNHVGPAEPKNMSFHNAPVFGLNWTNVCNEGYAPPACSFMSAGLTGKRTH